MLTKDQEKLITMLIEGNRITDIAKKIGVSRQTIYSWKDNSEVKAELDRRKQDLANQGNQLILRDLTTYIDNVKDLANDKSDKRVCLAANQYLLNRIYGNPTAVLETNNEDTGDNVDTNELEIQLNEFKKLRKVK